MRKKQTKEYKENNLGEDIFLKDEGKHLFIEIYDCCMLISNIMCDTWMQNLYPQSVSQAWTGHREHWEDSRWAGQKIDRCGQMQTNLSRKIFPDTQKLMPDPE